jgi:hypothetical protein
MWYGRFPQRIVLFRGSNSLRASVAGISDGEKSTALSRVAAAVNTNVRMASEGRRQGWRLSYSHVDSY